MLKSSDFGPVTLNGMDSVNSDCVISVGGAHLLLIDSNVISVVIFQLHLQFQLQLYFLVAVSVIFLATIIVTVIFSVYKLYKQHT